MKKNILLVLLFFNTKFFSQTIELEFFANGFNFPTAICHPNGDIRTFVVQKNGTILIINNNGLVNEIPFLDISSAVLNEGERGLLGLAFHPNYDTNGYFYINYINLEGNTVVSRFSVSTDPNLANNQSELILISINQPFPEHNGGAINFGYDGYLYIAMGDGGSSGDPNGYAQNLIIDNENPSRVFLGKMLRIDVDNTSGLLNYGIPITNPYVGQAGKEEIWAIGLRNPWKFSFNRLNGDLWIADVGQSEIEEINKITYPLPNNGLNFGWKCYEGHAIYEYSSNCPETNEIQLPFAEYSHEYGCSITGGYFYTGTQYPNFINKYFFADFCTGKIGMVNNNGDISWSSEFLGTDISTFGENSNGELFVAALGSGTIYKIIDTSLNTSSFDKAIISVYPNPTSDELFVKNENNIELSAVKITDLTGKMVLYQNSQLSSINISNLSKGMYFVTIETQTGNTVTSKIIKQ